MIAFGAAITDEEIYDRCAAVGFRLAAEPDTKVLAYAADGSIFPCYNMLLDRARRGRGPRGVRARHQDAEIRAADLVALSPSAGPQTRPSRQRRRRGAVLPLLPNFIAANDSPTIKILVALQEDGFEVKRRAVEAWSVGFPYVDP